MAISMYDEYGYNSGGEFFDRHDGIDSGPLRVQPWRERDKVVKSSNLGHTALSLEAEMAALTLDVEAVVEAATETIVGDDGMVLQVA